MIETQLRVILNSIVFDPMQPNDPNVKVTKKGENFETNFVDEEFEYKIKAGRCIESLKWFSLLISLIVK